MSVQTTNPELTAARIRRLKEHLHITYYDLGVLFGVRYLTVMRWANAQFAPRLVHQRTLARLERQHGLVEK